MRKHFLLLFLLTLLPLAGWAVDRDVKVYPQDIEKTYGAQDPVITKDMIYCEVTSGDALTDAELESIAAKLSIVRTQEGEDVNATGYSYRLSKSANPAGFRVYPQTSTAVIYINKKDLAGATLAYNEVNTMYYVNSTTQLKPQQGDFSVTISGLAVAGLNGTLTYGTDYTISTAADAYGENNTVGAATGSVKIVGSGNYKGTATLNFPIRGASISGAVVSYIGDALTFDGNPKTPAAAAFKLMLNNAEVASAGNWQIKDGSYEDHTNAGKGKVTIEGIGNFSGEVLAEFDIAKYTVPTNGLEITKNNPDYNGKAQLPTVTAVGVANTALVLAETDYEVIATTENISAGNYTATVKFTEDGNFKGTAQALPYTINKKSMTTIYKNVETIGITYTGSDITPEYTLKVANEEDAYVLQLNKDFTIVQTYNKNAWDNNDEHKSTIQFVAKANSNFTGETVADVYTIAPATLTVTPQDIFASYGSSINPTVVITGWKTAADETAGYTGEITYSYKNSNNENVNNPTAIGNYTITPNINNVTATNYVFEVDQNKAFANLTISAAELVVSIDNQTNVKYAANAAAFSLKYESGLSEADKANFNGANISNVSYQVIDGQNNVVATTPEGVNGLNVGAYTIKAVPTPPATSFGYAGYNVIINDGSLVVKQRDLSDGVTVVVNNGAAYQYNSYYYGVDAEAPAAYTVQLGGADVPNVENANYTVEWVRSKNATKDVEDYAADLSHFSGSAAQKAAAAAKYLSDNSAKLVVTATNTGNFKGSTEKVFSITKIDLDVTANDAEWKYGDAEPKDSYTSTIDKSDLAANDKGFNPAVASSWDTYLFTGSLKAMRTAKTGTSVGEYYNDDDILANKVGLIPYDIQATNYNIVPHVGKLTITKGDLTVKVKDFEEKYGEVYNVDNFDLEYVAGLSDDKVAGWKALVDMTDVNYTAIDPTDDVTVIQNVDVPTAVGSTVKLKAEGITSTNYNIHYQMGTYTVVKRPIAFKLEDQDIALGEEIDKIAAPAADYTISLVDNAKNKFIGDDKLADLLAAGNIEIYVADGAELLTGEATADAIRATINHPNYVLASEGNAWGENVWGTLTVAAVTPLTLDTEDTELMAKIEELDGASNIAVSFDNRTMKAKEWYTVVLPFTTTPAELVAELGTYVVVNRLNTETSALNNIHFSLEMDNIPAGEPFLIKPATALDWTTVDFASVTISKNLVDVETAGATFKGVYANQSIKNGYDLAGNADATCKYRWLSDTDYPASKVANDWRNPVNNARVIKPMEGYLLLPAATGNAPLITVEDFDGQTTSIQTLSGANLNVINNQGWYTVDGMKLQSAPAQKGVYINNGKKIVVK